MISFFVTFLYVRWKEPNVHFTFAITLRCHVHSSAKGLIFQHLLIDQPQQPVSCPILFPVYQSRERESWRAVERENGEMIRLIFVDLQREEMSVGDDYNDLISTFTPHPQSHSLLPSQRKAGFRKSKEERERLKTID